jgi:hypothetical protein
MTANNKKPGAGRRRVSEHVAGLQALYGKGNGSRLPANWRDRLPDPAHYYAQHVAKLTRPNGTGWAQGVCPFHEDRNASLSVHVIGARGGWRCFAGCGGGDMVGFHMRLRGCDFKTAVGELVRGGA